MKKNGNDFLLSGILCLKNARSVVWCAVLWGLLVMLPGEAMAQQQKVTIRVNGSTVREVFREINRQTGLDFVYSAEQLTGLNPVSLQMENKTVDEVLKELFKAGGFEYKFEMNSIIIKKKTEIQGRVELVTLEGSVAGSKGEPLPGVTIFLKGTTVGTVTRVDGTFNFTVGKSETRPVLVFSFVGMKRVERVVESGKPLKVVMEEDAASLDEVVITGYQTIDRRKNTSSIQTLNMEDIKVPGLQRIDQMLEGRVPGMTFMQNSGQVGAAPKIRVRGTSTVLGNQEPVWVLDGIILRDPVNVSPTQMNNLDFVNLVGNAISGINPDDIERIDILKDASATALYGAKAANGVIVVTTKKGKSGPPSVTYNMSGTFTRRPRYTDKDIYMMNSKERMAYSRELVEKQLSYPNITNYVGYEGALNKYLTGNYTYNQFQQEVDRLEGVNTDWFGLITEDAFSHNHSLSLSGGGGNVRYYASLGYMNENGVIKQEKNDRYSTMLKVNGTFDRLAFNFMLQANRGERNYTNQEVNILDYAYNTSRAVPSHNEDGSPYYYIKTAHNSKGTRLDLHFNALNEMLNTRDEYNTSAVTMTSDLNYRFTEDLKLQLMFSYGVSNTTEETVMDERSWYAARLRGNNYGERLTEDMKDWTLLPMGGEYREKNTRNDNYTLRTQVDYNKFLDKDRNHLLNASVGFEMSSNKYKGSQQTRRGYLAERGKLFSGFNPEVYKSYAAWQMNDDRNARGVLFDNLQNELSGYLTLTYTLNNTYSVNFNTRADASNKFGDRSNEQILPVWSVSGSWDMTEQLLSNVSWVNLLTVKSSFGYQGNILSEQSPELIIQRGNYDDDFGKFTSSIKHYPNPNLRWEKTRTINASMDFSLFNNSVRGTFSYFYKKTKDAFLNKTVSDINGRDNYVINSGVLENKGFEVSLNFTPINPGGNIGGFRWDFDPQIGQVVNSLLSKAMGDSGFEKVQDEIRYADYLNGSALVEGEPLNTFYSYKFAGLSPEDGRPTFYDVGEERADEYVKMSRDEVFRQVMEVSGTRVPVIQGGLSNTFSYKGMSLGFLFSYSLGSKIRLLKLYGADAGGSTLAPLPERNMRREFVDRWQKPGDELHSNIPGMLGNKAYIETLTPWWGKNPYAANRFSQNIWQMYDDSDLRTVSGNYLKLQNVSFRYTFPENFCKKIYVKSAHVGLSGTNLFTLCSRHLKGQDPSQSGSADQLNLSIRPSYSMSLSVTF